MTVELDSALPLTAGVRLAFGETGVVARFVGAAGGNESCVYERPAVEHAEMLPAASVAVANSVVVVLVGTVVDTPNAPPPVVEPEPSTVPVHDELPYMVTVELASAVPFTSGVALLLGELGVVVERTGRAGAVVSTVPVQSAELFPPVMRTWNVCDASERPEMDFGLTHDANAPPSIAHSVVVVPPPWTVQVNVAGVGPPLREGLVGPERFATLPSVKDVVATPDVAPVAVTS